VGESPAFKGFVRTQCILHVLEHRYVALAEDERLRLVRCGDLDVLDTLVERSYTSMSARELWADGAGAGK
jgi:hypothetical protein